MFPEDQQSIITHVLQDSLHQISQKIIASLQATMENAFINNEKRIDDMLTMMNQTHNKSNASTSKKVPINKKKTLGSILVNESSAPKFLVNLKVLVPDSEVDLTLHNFQSDVSAKELNIKNVIRADRMLKLQLFDQDSVTKLHLIVNTNYSGIFDIIIPPPRKNLTKVIKVPDIFDSDQDIVNQLQQQNSFLLDKRIEFIRSYSTEDSRKRGTKVLISDVEVQQKIISNGH